LGPGTLSDYIEVSKYPKYGGRTLGPGALSYYIEVPKSLKNGGEDVGSWSTILLY
jgi:hypothetical protein